MGVLCISSLRNLIILTKWVNINFIYISTLMNYAKRQSSNLRDALKKIEIQMKTKLPYINKMSTSRHPNNQKGKKLVKLLSNPSEENVKSKIAKPSAPEQRARASRSTCRLHNPQDAENLLLQDLQTDKNKNKNPYDITKILNAEKTDGDVNCSPFRKTILVHKDFRNQDEDNNTQIPSISRVRIKRIIVRPHALLITQSSFKDKIRILKLNTKDTSQVGEHSSSSESPESSINEDQCESRNKNISNNGDADSNDSSSDVMQGHIVDDSFMVAAYGLASHPSIIKNLFMATSNNENSQYAVKMYINGEEKQTMIDDYFPNIQKTPILSFAHPSENQDWLVLLKKTWAKISNSSSNIIGNINPYYLIKLFTGAPSIKYSHALLKNRDELWQILKTESNLKKIIISQHEIDSDKAQTKCHYYNVLGTKEISINGSHIQLLNMKSSFNDAGSIGKSVNQDEPNFTEDIKAQMNYIANDEQGFHMSFEDYVTYFSSTSLCNINPSYEPKSITLGHAMGGYSACSIVFPSTTIGYIYVSYLDSVLQESNSSQFKGFHVGAGLWKKIRDGSYEYISKIRNQGAFMYLINNEKISKGEYLVVLECRGKQKNSNKVVLTSYSKITPYMTDEKLSISIIKQLMIAISSKTSKTQLPESKDMYYVYNYAESGVSFSSYLLCNQSTDKSITQTVKFSDSSIVCYPPYDSKPGEFYITVAPSHQEIVLFRAKFASDILKPITIFPVSKINSTKIDVGISPTQSSIKRKTTMTNGKKPEPNSFTEIAEDIKKMMGELIQSYKTNEKCLNYNTDEASILTREIAEQLISNISKVYDTYKFAATCILLNKKEGGLHMSSSCYWDDKTDGHIMIQDSNDALYFFLNVFAIY